jgi:predicted Zn finger-like uncharacterized protein
VKFLCDRCKTRYSIADERVRGKILKIRCKNCANVITVREGMEQPAELLTPIPQPVAPQRSGQRAAIAPGAGMSGKPLEAAFATAMSSPGITVPPAAPAALDEEWYVSIDGNQQGPFSLGQAQSWVRARGPDDELYCWSEGFDDWLPVEKVSHFRGLRGRVRAATMPPPLPIDQSEPKPLFAATLAALEQDAPTSIGAPPVSLEDLMPARAVKPQPASGPVPAPSTVGKTTGRTSALPAPGVGPRGRDGAPPLPGTGPMKSPTGPAIPIAAAPSGPLPAVSSTSNPSLAAAPAPASNPISSMFGKGSSTTPAPIPSNGAKGANGHDPGASATQPMFDNAGIDDGDAAPDALSAGAARGTKGDEDEVEGNDDLAIGEVSRVVRLDDLVRPSQVNMRSTGAVPAMGRRTPQAGAVARGTGAVPKFEQAALAASGDGLPSTAAIVPPPLTGTESEIVQQLAQPPRATSHRMLLFGGLGVVAILATLVIVFSTRGGDDEDPTQGPRLISGEEGLEDISMEVAVEVLPQPTNPDTNPTTNPPTNGSGTKPPTNGGGTSRPKNPNSGGNNGGGNNGGGKDEPDPRGLTALSGDDVVAMSQKMSTGPRRCYEQAKKKDPFLDVKRLRAVITVDKAGTVTRVELIDHANQQLDSCLSGAIGRWKFRENTSGLTSQVSFAFMSG